jgi:TolB-like protein
MKSRIHLVLCLALGLSGCAFDPFSDPFLGPGPEARLLKLNQGAADTLAAGLKDRIKEMKAGRAVVLPDTILVTSLVDVSDVKRTTPFGRMCAEQIAARLVDQGYTVPELKMAEVIRVSDGDAHANWGAGEFALSRDVRDLAAARNASIIVVGTYAVGDQQILVTVRAVDATTSQIVVAKSYTTPLTTPLLQKVR